MELDYKRLHETTMRELLNKTNELLMYETLANQLNEETRRLQNLITEKDTEIENLKREIEELKKVEHTQE